MDQQLIDLICERRRRAYLAGSFDAISIWLHNEHGITLPASSVESIYIQAQAQARPGSSESSERA